jgi:endoglucanase
VKLQTTWIAVCIAIASQIAGAHAGNVVLKYPKVDGEGYFSNAAKVFCISGADAAPGAAFVVQNRAGAIVYRGNLSGVPVDDVASTGETVIRGDFTPLTAEGVYRVVVGDRKSALFRISSDPYASLFHDAARTLSLLRCGVAIDDPVTGLKHPPCHMSDTHSRGSTKESDFTGGWHNAGDYGKWTHATSIDCSLLMWLYTLRPAEVAREELAIGESRPGVPDLLSEARWGLTWLLKMQRPDGSVFHKVDSEPKFAWGIKPQDDPTNRYAADPSTIDAADFAAVMAQAALVFAPFDSDFARTCGSAADRSWTWVTSNPGIGESDPYYADSDPSQEYLWAECAMATRTHDTKLIARIKAAFDRSTPNMLLWDKPDSLGWLAVATDPSMPDDARLSARRGLIQSAQSAERIASTDGYGVAIGPYEYCWCSNDMLLGRVCLMLFAYDLDRDDAHRSAALEQLHYLLGRNSLGQSFVTRHGSDPIKTPYNWTWYDFHVLIPGWLVGGPDRYISPITDKPLVHLIQAGTPPAKCYLDLCAADGSWASNEGDITGEAELIFAIGMVSNP